MKRQKRCLICHEQFNPYGRSYRRQRVCSKKACQKEKRRRNWRKWRLKNVKYAIRHQSDLKEWIKKNPEYWKKWRAAHPEYVARNRLEQRRRNTKKRGMIAKPTTLEELMELKLAKIKHFELSNWTVDMVAKPTILGEEIQQKIEGICGFMRWFWVIAKPILMDRNGVGCQNNRHGYETNTYRQEGP